MIVNRELLAALRNVIVAAAVPTCQASLEDLTTIQLAADDMEASIHAYEIWIGREAEASDEEVRRAVLDLKC